jgi:hypothetical protein
MSEDAESVAVRYGMLGGAFSQFVTEDGGANARILRAAEFSAPNTVTEARSPARMYAVIMDEVMAFWLLDMSSDMNDSRVAAVSDGVG